MRAIINMSKVFYKREIFSRFNCYRIDTKNLEYLIKKHSKRQQKIVTGGILL